jgi:hypothetical protein
MDEPIVDVEQLSARWPVRIPEEELFVEEVAGDSETAWEIA